MLRRAELVRNRRDPLEQSLEVRAGGPHVARGEVDELAGEAPARRAPEVLLDQPVRVVEKGLALVERAGDARGERVDERRQGARLFEIRLSVADPDLHGREGKVWPHAPP